MTRNSLERQRIGIEKDVDEVTGDIKRPSRVLMASYKDTGSFCLFPHTTTDLGARTITRFSNTLSAIPPNWYDMSEETYNVTSEDLRKMESKESKFHGE